MDDKRRFDLLLAAVANLLAERDLPADELLGCLPADLGKSEYVEMRQAVLAAVEAESNQ